MSEPGAGPERCDAIVVGAGISGLTAARLLAREGQRVVVIEARGRIGGRVHSERIDGRVTDLGASWIHGIADSPVHAATRALGMPDVEFTVGSYQPGGRPIAYFGPDGERLDAADVERFVADIAAVDARLPDAIGLLARGASYADAADAAVAAVTAEHGWDPDRAERVTEFLYHRAEEQYGVDAAELDAHGLDDDETEGDEVVFPEGYDRLAAGLAEGLDIRLGRAATRVAWSESGVEVTWSASGEAVGPQEGGGTIAADRAVVTVPVGVLRSGGLEFAPALPEPVAGALAGLEMNAFEKVFLRFEERFWGGADGAGSDGAREPIYAVRRQGDAAEWWHSWYDLTPLDGEPTLLTFAAAACARETRAWSDDRIVASVMASLREIFGDGVPDPVRARVTRWQDDPWALGSYAFLVPGARPEDHERVATPIGAPGAEPVLHLAGETTWQEDPATVTAALRSGHRAAERIIGRAIPMRELLASLAR
ncbi:FAD-dependent oxidoreductase [Leucobacter zeae]|nr:FAD-dependent oxidoreductase [Leucobacter zeae]